MRGRVTTMRAALLAVLLAVLGAPAAHADTKVTSLQPWAQDNVYLVREDLDGRTAPRLEPRASVDYLKAGQWVRITCQTTGESAYGSTIWDKVGRYYVPDHYIKTYTDGFIAKAPRCGAEQPPPPPPPPKPKRYVALGDSYQSGEGVGSYYGAAPGRPFACHRSFFAYSQVLARYHSSSVVHSPSQDFFACSGAVVSGVRDQLSALGDDVGVVTVGVGGNDIQFERILKRCIANVRAPCRAWVNEYFKPAALQGYLRPLYQRIKTRARNAVVIVVGYPRLFTERTDGKRCRFGLLRGDDVPLLNRTADRLDAAIASVAREFGFRFVDPRAAFAVHGVCADPGTSWIYAPGESTLKGSFHPNRAGQQALADLIAGANRDVFR